MSGSSLILCIVLPSHNKPAGVSAVQAIGGGRQNVQRQEITSIYCKKVPAKLNQAMRSNISSTDSRFGNDMSHLGQEA